MNKTILLLLVEDEPLIADIAETALTDGGYEVLTAYSGAEAIGMIDARSDEIAGLITDIRLGGAIDGWKVARHGREMKPDIAVVYMTGDSAADWAVNGVPKSLLVQKPFAAMQLVTAISNLLTEADSTPA
jgi:DNA-binding NtrC family response regulator